MPDADRFTGHHLSPRDGAAPAARSLPSRRTPAQLFDDLFELSAVGMAHVGLDGRWLRVNRRLCEITGYTRQELLARTWQDLIAPGDRDESHARRESLDDDRAAGAGIEKRYVRKNGSLVWVRIMASLVRAPDDSPEYSVAVVEDISQRKQLEAERDRLLEHERAARAAAEERANELQVIFDAMADGIIVYDRHGHMLRTNTANRDILGNPDEWPAYFSLPIEERLARLDMCDESGQPVPPERWPHMRVLRGEVLSGPTAAQVSARALDGHVKQLSISGAPLRDAGGQIVGAVCIHHDVTERRRLEEHAREVAAEAAARASQLQAVLDAIQDGVFVYDRDNHLVLANPAAQGINPLTDQPAYLERPFAERIAQFALRDAQGHPLVPDELPAARVLRGEVLTGDAAVDTMMLQPDGREILINTSGAPVRAPDGTIQGVVVVTRDVTERRRLERRTQDALRALLAMAEALVGASTDALPPEGAPAHAADSDLLAQRLVELTHDMLGCDRVAMSGIEPDTGALRPIAVVGLADEAERWWRAELPRHRIAEYLPSDLIEHLRAGEVVRNAGEVRLRAGGPPLPDRSVLVAPLRVADRLIGILTYDYGHAPHTYTPDEMTLASAVAQLAALAIERERLLQEREEAHGRAIALQEANQRMDEFLSIAAHELRTPVTVIKMNLQLLARAAAKSTLAGLASAQQPRADPDLLQRTEKQVERLTRLVDDLLDVTRIRAGKLELRREPTDLVAVVREAVAEQRAAHPERRITLEVPGDEAVVVLADPDRIGQVITNYLTNALKYSAPDKLVAVRLTRGPVEARVTIRDRGPGIPPAEREHIWELFHRVPGIEVQSGSGVGLGLGLHLCQTIVERHGGRVGVESAVGRGSTFWFTLPLDGAPDSSQA